MQPLQVVEFPEASGEKVFSYDAEWLAVLRSTHSMLSLQRHVPQNPGVTCGMGHLSTSLR